MYTYIYRYTCIQIYIYVHTHTYIYIYTYTFLYRYTHKYIYIYTYIYIYIYASLPEVEYSDEELKAITCVRQSSSNELNTSVFDSVKCKRMKVDTKCVIGRLTGKLLV